MSTILLVFLLLGREKFVDDELNGNYLAGNVRKKKYLNTVQLNVSSVLLKLISLDMCTYIEK